MRASRPALLLLAAAAITGALGADRAGHVHRGAAGEADRFHRHAHLGPHRHAREPLSEPPASRVVPKAAAAATAPAAEVSKPAESGGGVHGHRHGHGHVHGYTPAHSHGAHHHQPGEPVLAHRPGEEPLPGRPAADSQEHPGSIEEFPAATVAPAEPEEPAPEPSEPPDGGYYQPPTAPPIPASPPSIGPTSRAAAAPAAPRSPPVDLVSRLDPFGPRPPPA